MSKITKKQFLLDVRHEIEALKKNATADEKARLDFKDFNPSNTRECFYGQLTGSCCSSRAKVLMDMSCIRVFGIEWDDVLFETKSYKDFIPALNGAYNAQDWKGNDRALNYLSALEGYIYASDAKNKQIISYIKGETETLVL